MIPINSSGCSIQVAGQGLPLSSGTVTISACDGATASLISSGAIVTVGSTVPEDMNAAYAEFIQAKRQAMAVGGSVSFGSSTQTFAVGYQGQSRGWLMTLNGIPGPCISFVPTVGIWAVTTTVSGGLNTRIARLPACITCDDWNTLYALEMTVYHAINKVGWRILRSETAGSTTVTASPGSWQQYQGILATWALYAYQSQFVFDVQALRESLFVQIGYANNTCNKYAIYVCAHVTLTNAASGSLYYDLVFYPQNLLTDSKQAGVDNNKEISSIAIPVSSGTAAPVAAYHVARTNSGTSGAWLTNTTSDSIISGGVATITSSASIFNTTYNQPATSNTINGLADNTTGFTGGYELGLLVNQVPGNNYFVKQFALGLKPILTDHLVEGSVSKLDTYTVSATWYIRPYTTSGTLGPMFSIVKSAGNYDTYAAIIAL